MPQLVPFCFWLARPTGEDLAPHALECGALIHAISVHLAALGWPGSEPLRWAITAVDAERGLQLEGVGLWDQQQARSGR